MRLMNSDELLSLLLSSLPRFSNSVPPLPIDVAEHLISYPPVSPPLLPKNPLLSLEGSLVDIIGGAELDGEQEKGWDYPPPPSLLRGGG